MSGESPDLRRSVLSVGAANLLSRFTGLLREVAFAAAFGAGVAADAYNAAFRIGNLFRELFAEGALSNAFVPLYADVEEKDSVRGAFALANAFLGVLLVALGGVTLLTLIFAEPLVYLVAAGFAEEAGKVELTATLTRILAPFVATVSVASVFMGMLNVRGRFFLPAVTPVVFNALIIAACLGADRFEALTGAPAIHAVAWAAVLGGALQAAVQLPMLKKGGFRLRPTLGKHPELRRLLSFLGPAVVAISVTQVNLLIETQLASREGDGPVSWLLYSFRVAHLPFSIVSGAVGVASLAGLSVLAAKGDHEGFRRTLTGGLNLNSFLLLPAAVGLYLLADPVVALFFERGAFTPQDTAVTAELLRMYAVAILAIGAQRILVPVFYTLNDPRTPMWVGLGMVALKLPVALGLMAVVGLGGIPLSHAVLGSLEVGLLLAILHGRVGSLVGELLGFHAKVALASAVMGGAVWYGRGLLPGELGAVALAAIGAVIYLGVADLIGLREGREVLRRVLRRRPKGLPPTVDEATRALLSRLAIEPSGEPRLVDGRLEIPLADGLVRFEATEGIIHGALEPGEHPVGARLEVAAVMRVGQGPPQLHGLRLGERSFRADGDAISPGEAPGPILPVEGRDG